MRKKLARNIYHENEGKKKAVIFLRDARVVKKFFVITGNAKV